MSTHPGHEHASSDVDTLSFQQLRALFATLDAPPVAEMHGEFGARLLAQFTPAARLLFSQMLNNPLTGYWQAKAFRPVDAEQGRGYNLFRKGERLLQRYPMLTLIAPSRYDGKPAYTLVYRAFHSRCGDIHMVDEVRSLGRGRYLGLGTCGFSDRQRRLAMPFLLEGPQHAYRGDIGVSRSLDLATELPALR